MKQVFPDLVGPDTRIVHGVDHLIEDTSIITC